MDVCEILVACKDLDGLDMCKNEGSIPATSIVE
jgi:hypothetical protein